MLPQVATMFTTAVNLLEAEGRLARLYTVKVATSLFVVFFAICGAGLGLLAVLVGATWVLATLIGGPAALVLTGTIVAGAGGAAAWMIYRRLLRSGLPELRTATTHPEAIGGNQSHESATGFNQTGARGDRVPQNATSSRGAQAAAY